MRILFAFLIISMINVCLIGQTVITSASFPEAGDVLKTMTVFSPSGDFTDGIGGDQSWDFSNLTADFTDEEVYLDIADADFDDLFQSATAYQGGAGVGEGFFKGTDTEFAFLGFAGTDLTGLGFGSNLIYSNPYVVRRAMTFSQNERFQTTASAVYRVSIDDLPDVLADSLLGMSPIPFDSIGIGLTFEREDLMDAWGTLKIPGGSFDVIREKQIEYVGTSIEIKLPFVGWSDISDLLGFGGGDTTITYQYLSNDAKEPIAVVTMSNDETEVESVDFKDMGVNVGTHTLGEQVFEFSIAPNPTNGPLTVSISNLPFGEYELVVYNLNGKMLRKEAFQAKQQVDFDFQFDNFSNGNYYFGLKNSNGQQIATEKFILNK